MVDENLRREKKRKKKKLPKITDRGDP